MGDYDKSPVEKAIDAMAATFEKYSETDYIKFERVERKRYHRPDINGFMLLDELLPTTHRGDMVCGASHDEIYLDADAGEIALKITDEQILELVRCGIRYDADNYSFCMFA